MDVAAFIADFRVRVDDTAGDLLWSDASAVVFLNEALDEACERARLIEDRTTAACCAIALVTAQADYALHPTVILVKRVTFRGQVLEETSPEKLDRQYGGSSWETRTGLPCSFIQTEGKIRLVPFPSVGYNTQSLAMTVVRRELLPRTLAGATNGAPELAVRWHSKLVDWMAHRAYSVADTETLNPVKAAEFAARFTTSFGERVDANVQRKQRDRRVPVTRFRF